MKALEALGLPIRVKNTSAISPEIGAETLAWLDRMRHVDTGWNPCYILHTQPDAFAGISVPKGARRVGVTIFETDRIPETWVPPCNALEEIWVPSQFNLETFVGSGVDRHRIRVVPYAVDTAEFHPGADLPPYPFPPDTRRFKFLYTFAFDYRKGFDLLLQAYSEEFSSAEDVSLVLKVYQPAWANEVDVLEELQRSIPKRPDTPHIQLIFDRIDHSTLKSLYRSVDCYVSTDRANGWGMPAMEVMAMGKPAITIDWSGSTEFMTDRNAFLIKPTGRLVPVDMRLQKKRPELYMGHCWAEVEVGEVRRVLREAFESRMRREALAQQAATDMQAQFSVLAVADRVKDCLRMNSSKR